jgi:hypothetical protein
MFNFFKKDDDYDFKFSDTIGAFYNHYPPILAKDLKPLKEHQEKKYGEYKFPGCPGMHDFSRMGYIIPAWTDFHIKSNKAGTVALVGSLGEDNKKRGSAAGPPQPMAKDITDGLFEMNDSIKHEIFNFPAPWKIYTKKNVSCLLLPAFYHSNFLDDLYVYPGVVDYNGFTVMNFICSPKRACEVHIKAGDPILHVIPVITNKEIVASYGPSTTDERFYSRQIKWFHEKNFYRKFYMLRKKYKIFKDTKLIADTDHLDYIKKS